MTRRWRIPAVKWAENWCIVRCISTLNSNYLCFQPYKLMLAIQGFLGIYLSRTWRKIFLLEIFYPTFDRSERFVPIEILPGISKTAIPRLETVFRISGGVELTNSIFKLIWTSFAGSPSGVVTDNLVLNGISGLKLFDIFSSKAIITGFRLIMQESLNSSSVRPFSTVTLSQGSKDRLSN